jgi:hypothetical protein
MRRPSLPRHPAATSCPPSTTRHSPDADTIGGTHALLDGHTGGGTHTHPSSMGTQAAADTRPTRWAHGRRHTHLHDGHTGGGRHTPARWAHGRRHTRPLDGTRAAAHTPPRWAHGRRHTPPWWARSARTRHADAPAPRCTHALRLAPPPCPPCAMRHPTMGSPRFGSIPRGSTPPPSPSDACSAPHACSLCAIPLPPPPPLPA